MTRTTDHGETLRKMRALLGRLKERERIRRRDERRDAIARRIMQGLVILFGLYVAYGVVRCTVAPICPAYPFFRLFAGE
jgi:hypothetical protein